MNQAVIPVCACKICTKCGEEKSFSLFSKSAKAIDGHSAACKACWSAHGKGKRAEQRAIDPVAYNKERCAVAKKWADANPLKVKARRANFSAKNADSLAAISLAWYEKNKAKVSEKNALAYKENPAKYKAASIKWGADNSEKKRAHKQNRRSRKLDAGGSLSSGLVELLLVLQRNKCACCGASLANGYHLDHVMPLFLGGSNEDGNMQLLTPTCNMQKHAKHPIDFMQSRGFLL